MAERDEYDELTERLLPCVHEDFAKWEVHSCPHGKRPAIAAEFREAGKREAELREIIEDAGIYDGRKFEVEKAELRDEVADLRREAGQREAQCHAIIEEQAQNIEDGRVIYDAALQVVADLRREVENYASVIDETLRLADLLNGAAEQGAGFAEHWGERVMQTVEPLRKVKSFPSETLSHNRSLVEYNSKLISERDDLRREVERLRNDLVLCKAGVIQF